MTRIHKIEAWIAVLVAILLAGSVVALIRWQRQKPLSLRGAVLVEDSDPRKQQPITGVTISAGDLAISPAQSDSSGLFIVRLRKPVRKGHPIVLNFRAPQFRPLELNDVVSSKLYVVRLVPLSSTPAPKNQPEVKVSNVRVRYTVSAMTELNVGSAVKTFDVENRGNVACKGQQPCSPDGRWKAALGSATLDAGAGNEFRGARASCIAGPCPFTRIEEDHLAQGGQAFMVSALNWSDTATFLLEAEVFRPMVSQAERWSYPVIFGAGLSFTLPSEAQSVSIEADLDGQTIIFPLGPSLFLSWATCDAGVNPDKGRIYRCTPKPGYRFQ
ncbi:MAG: hypothetical protein ABSD75_04210 [Terriglobales bacterium]|jgi:hypothetical protein